MFLNKELLRDTSETFYMLVEILVKHFDYSMRDIHSYEDLTEAEKEIIPEEIFNELLTEKEEHYESNV
jgi:hypothetical protein